MKKLLVLLIGVVALVTGGLMMSSSAVDAGGCFRCFPGGTTGAAWGFGSTCQAATNDAINQASALIPGYCDTCSETVISLAPCGTDCSNTATCYTPYGEWRVDVKIKYKCNEYICA